MGGLKSWAKRVVASHAFVYSVTVVIAAWRDGGVFLGSEHTGSVFGATLNIQVDDFFGWWNLKYPVGFGQKQ